MNKIKKILELKKSLKQNKVDKSEALTQLGEIINSEDSVVSELDIYKEELKKLKKIRDKKDRISNKITTLNKKNNDIFDFLNLKDDEMQKIKGIGYKLI